MDANNVDGVAGPPLTSVELRLESCDVLDRDGRPYRSGQEKGAKIPTSKAPISVDFHSFRLTFGRGIISRNGLDRERLSLERARAERPR